ncbi:MAG: tail protein X [Clostridia bacterium]|nr:tail protein X [Clostridia bacterium]
MTYITKQGDMWDSIAHSELGDVKHTDALMEANTKHIDTFIFSSGVELELPDVSEAVTETDLPPWKRVSG